jgi:hypothetical protein
VDAQACGQVNSCFHSCGLAFAFTCTPFSTFQLSAWLFFPLTASFARTATTCNNMRQRLQPLANAFQRIGLHRNRPPHHMDASKPPYSSLLLKLPAELRKVIYDYIIGEHRVMLLRSSLPPNREPVHRMLATIHPPKPARQDTIAIRLTCTQIARETISYVLSKVLVNNATDSHSMHFLTTIKEVRAFRRTFGHHLFYIRELEMYSPHLG